MKELFIISFLLLFLTFAEQINSHEDVLAKLNVLERTLNDLMDFTYIQKERNEDLALRILQNQKEFKQTKDQYSRKIQALETRVRKLEDITKSQERDLMIQRKSSVGEKSFITHLKHRLAKVEKIHVSQFQNPCDPENSSRVNASKSLLMDNINAERIQSVYVFTWTFRSGNGDGHSVQLMINTVEYGSVYHRTLHIVEAEETGIVVAHVTTGDNVRGLSVKVCVESSDGEDYIFENINALPNNLSDKKDDMMYILKQQNKDLELKLHEDKENFERIKNELYQAISNLDTRLRTFEGVIMDQNREINKLKQEKEDDRRYINRLEKRLIQLENKFEKRDEERNSSCEKAIEDNRSTNYKNVERIQKRLLSPPTTSHGSIAFYAYMSAWLPSPNTHQVLVFDDVKTNIGNAYHPSTGLFIVPESGVYVFTWTFRMGGSRDHSIQLLINKDVFGTLYLQTVNGLEAQETGIVVAHVNAGDDVYVRTHATLTLGTSDYIQSNSYGRTSFAGWKLF
ncbi:uncharacterized protein LOC133201660 [Saccostrea echinata]|uniref:uncharacterized protein LOC133201660 n=1 Tax=Saccostrea echinata TaxID=191078 RepID=UPI002A7F6DDE|nr:uncharacterized protein LOC133201660 [Saccostrea echinata]